MDDVPFSQAPEEKQLERRIEALLFASDTPLSVKRISSLIGEESLKDIRKAIDSLKKFYSETQRSFTIVEVAGGYQIATLPEFSSLISRLFKGKRKSRLSQPALETLAIVAQDADRGDQRSEL